MGDEWCCLLASFGCGDRGDAREPVGLFDLAKSDLLDVESGDTGGRRSRDGEHWGVTTESRVVVELLAEAV